jgi:hypothetical protein
MGRRSFYPSGILSNGMHWHCGRCLHCTRIKNFVQLPDEAVPTFESQFVQPDPSIDIRSNVMSFDDWH